MYSVELRSYLPKLNIQEGLILVLLEKSKKLSELSEESP
jgi:hypothetical protein